MSKSIYDPLGSLTYATKAIQKIVAMKLAEIDGLLAIDKNIIQKFSHKLMDDDYKGINVEVSDTQVAIDVNVVTEYGKYIPELYQEAITLIKQEITYNTGLTLVEFNLNVEDILTHDEYQTVIRRETKAENIINESIIDNQFEYFPQGKERTISEKVNGTFDEMKDKANELGQKVSDKTEEALKNIKAKATNLGEAIVDKAEEAKTGIEKTAEETKKRAQEVGDDVNAKTKLAVTNIKKKSTDLEDEVVAHQETQNLKTTAEKKIEQLQQVKKADVKTE